jgi:hypothetical protein
VKLQQLQIQKYHKLEVACVKIARIPHMNNEDWRRVREDKCCQVTKSQGLAGSLSVKYHIIN